MDGGTASAARQLAKQANESVVIHSALLITLQVNTGSSTAQGMIP